jgi:hypothetical protein
MPHKKLSELVTNAESFDEKATQVLPTGMVAFGIEIDSRYGKCSELIELLKFAQAAASAAVAHYVKEAFYDSKASICSFELDIAVIRGSEIEEELLSIARATVGHFMWFDDEVFDSEPPDA